MKIIIVIKDIIDLGLRISVLILLILILWNGSYNNGRYIYHVDQQSRFFRVIDTHSGVIYSGIEGLDSAKYITPLQQDYAKRNYYLNNIDIPKNKLQEIALEIANNYEIPKDMFLGVIRYESNDWKVYDSNSPNKNNIGIARLSPEIAKKMGLNTTGDIDDERWHSGKALDALARYFVKLKNEFGDWKSVLRGYKTGNAKSTPEGEEYINNIIKSADIEADEFEKYKKK